jgi:hypothetical protein
MLLKEGIAVREKTRFIRVLAQTSARLLYIKLKEHFLEKKKRGNSS